MRTSPVTSSSPAAPSRARRRLLLAGALPVLVALLVAARLLVVAYADHRAAASWDAGRYADARAAAALNDSTGVPEGWVAPHDEGVAALATGDADGAVTLLVRSLAADPPAAQECLVRVDLALAQEAVGNAAQDADTDAARAAWSAGLDALARCLPGGGARAGTAKDVAGDADTVAGRLEALLEAQPEQSDGSSSESDEDSEQTQRPRRSRRAQSELDERTAQGERIRRRYAQQGELNAGQTDPAW
ncbi:hypothetical protein [Nocardioides sp. GY 10127]|uniref:hypothetical protein n=1 Tax=Nocardioides sp. GY 10127 TaxID=2569762 RepID=UPI0010A91336|nr:hypothetical protein [Nocardioides sp. GY 10127]TIC78931.1 hypothetical protein E8D37_18830 [Nocardioides sp. GY 10127]